MECTAWLAAGLGAAAGVWSFGLLGHYLYAPGVWLNHHRKRLWAIHRHHEHDFHIRRAVMRGGVKQNEYVCTGCPAVRYGEEAA